jgi:WD40 repeat protein
MNDPVPLPAVLGRFQVRAALGSGAFGTVYRAFDPVLDRDVALKVPHPAVLQDARLRERFLREARTAAGLHHPHIVPVFDAGLADGQHYLAAAFIEGRPLAEMLAQPLDARRAAALVRDLAEALAYAHSQGVVHRDVKPDNILVEPGDVAYLMDFGLAFHEAADKLTHDGDVLGTPAYIAPEQARGRLDDPLPAADQYSLGVVLYEMLTGRTLFAGPAAAVLASVLTQEPPAPRKLEPHLPRDLETVCLKCLAKRPEDRYADCAALADDLRRWLDGEPVRARRMGLGERLVRWCRREPSLAAAGLAATLALLAAALVPLATSARLARAVEEERQAEHRARHEADLAEEKAVGAARSQRKAEAAARATRQAIADARRAEADARAVTRQADRDTARAQAAVGLAEQRLQAVDRYRYVAHISRAAADDWAALAAALDPWRPGRAGAEQPGFEWHYLQRVLRLRPEAVAADLGAWGGQARFLDDGTLERLWVAPTPAGMAIRWSRHVPGDPGARRDFALPQPLNRAEAQAALEPVCSAGLRLLARRHSTTSAEFWEPNRGWRVVLKGLPRSISRSAFQASADSIRIATAHGRAGVWLWEIGKWKGLKGDLDSPPVPVKEMGRLETGIVWALYFSPDGKRLFTFSYGGALRLWDVDSRKRLLDLPGPGSRVEGLDERSGFSPDGRTLALWWGEKLWLLDAETGKERRPPLPCRFGRFSPRGERLAVVLPRPDRGILLLDPSTGKQTARVEHSSPVGSLAYSPDARLLAAADSAGRTVIVWDAVTRRKRGILAGPGEGCRVMFSPDGKWLAATGRGGELRLWPGPAFEAFSRLDGLTRPAYSLAVVGDPPVLVLPATIGGPAEAAVPTVERQAFELIDPLTGSRRAVSPPQSSPVVHVAAAGRLLATAAADGTVKLWGLDPLAEKRRLKGPPRPAALAASADGAVLAVGCADGRVQAWDTATGAPRFALPAEGGPVAALAVAPDGKHLVVAQGKGLVRRLDAANGKEVGRYRGHAGTVHALAVAAVKGRSRLATGGAAGTIRLWDLDSGRESAILKGHDGPVLALAFSPDGRTLAGGGEDGVRLWEPLTGEELLALPGPGNTVAALAFAPRLDFLAAATVGGTVRLWRR